jgi:hypothetical protein
VGRVSSQEERAVLWSDLLGLVFVNLQGWPRRDTVPTNLDGGAVREREMGIGFRGVIEFVARQRKGELEGINRPGKRREGRVRQGVF